MKSSQSWSVRALLRTGMSALRPIVVLAFLLAACPVLAKPPKSGPEPILLVVMDPLAKELACACVKGYGQRDYRKVAVRLEKAVKQRVTIEFSDDLAESMAGVGPGREVIVVGDRSLVAAGAKKAALKCHPVCELTGRDGNTTLAGLFIARSDDPAKELKDIGGRKVLIGLAEADGKHAASLASLRAAGLAPPARTEKRASYSDAALDLADSSLSPPPVAVIPGYALPLLEGCGSVKPGSLKVIGKTEAVPFIAVFLSDTISAEKEGPGWAEGKHRGLLAGLARAGSRWACAATAGATAGDNEVHLEKGRHEWRPCRFKRQRRTADSG